MMLRMRREMAGSESQITPQIDDLFLIDRTVDPLTPLLTQLTYEGLIDEVYDIQNSKWQYLCWCFFVLRKLGIKLETCMKSDSIKRCFSLKDMHNLVFLFWRTFAYCICLFLHLSISHEAKTSKVKFTSWCVCSHSEVTTGEVCDDQ